VELARQQSHELVSGASVHGDAVSVLGGVEAGRDDGSGDGAAVLEGVGGGGLTGCHKLGGGPNQGQSGVQDVAESGIGEGGSQLI
jgi:hypothetical protein